MSPPKKRPLPDWDPAGPKGKVKPRTLEQKVADDLRDIERGKQQNKDTLQKWEDEAARRRAEEARKLKEKQDRERAHPEWADSRTKCLAALVSLGTKITLRKNDWSNVVIDVSAAYETAYKNLTNLLNEKNATNQLLFNIAFSALAAVSVGGLAVFFTQAGDKWVKKGATQLFVDSAEDAVQAGVGALLTNVAAPLAANAASLETTAIPSPFSLKGELDKILNDMESEMLRWTDALQQDVKTLDLEEFENFTPQKLDDKIALFLAEKDKQFNSKPFLVTGRSKTDLAAELEKLMTGLWAVSFCEKTLLAKVFHQRLPGAVIDKLVKYGFVSDAEQWSDADVLRLARDWGPAVAAAMRRLITNVKMYQVKKFGK